MAFGLNPLVQALFNRQNTIGRSYDGVQAMANSAEERRRQGLIAGLDTTQPGSLPPISPPPRDISLPNGSLPPAALQQTVAPPPTPLRLMRAPANGSRMGAPRGFNDGAESLAARGDWRMPLPQPSAPMSAPRPLLPLVPPLSPAPQLHQGHQHRPPAPILAGGAGSTTLAGGTNLGSAAGVGMYRNDIAPNGSTAAVRYNNPAAAWPSERALKFGMTGFGVLNDGQNNRIARFNTPAQGAAYNMDLLARKYRGMSIGDAVRKWRGGNPGSGSIPAGYSADTVLSDALLGDREFMVDFFGKMAGHEGRGGAALDRPVLDAAFDSYRAVADGDGGAGNPAVDAANAMAAPPAVNAANAMAAPPGGFAIPVAGDNVNVKDLNPQFGSSMSSFVAAANAAGVDIKVRSGYRTNEHQARLHAQKGKWAAPPGRSNHNHGLAADLAFGSPAAKQWAQENAAKFGMHFPLLNHPSIPEDWHIEPLGVDGKRVIGSRGVPELAAGAQSAPMAGGSGADTLMGGNTAAGGTSVARQPTERMRKLAELLQSVGSSGGKAALPVGTVITARRPMGAGLGEEAALQEIVAEGGQGAGVRSVGFMAPPSQGGIDRRRQMAEALMSRGQDGQATTIAGGLGQMVDVLGGGIAGMRASGDESRRQSMLAQALQGAAGGGDLSQLYAADPEVAFNLDQQRSQQQQLAQQAAVERQYAEQQAAQERQYAEQQTADGRRYEEQQAAAERAANLQDYDARQGIDQRYAPPAEKFSLYEGPDGRTGQQSSTTGKIDYDPVGPQPPNPPADVLEYEYYANQERAAGREPESFGAHQAGLQRAGATTVNTGENSARSFSKKLGEATGTSFAAIVESGLSAKQRVSDIDTVMGSLDRTPGQWRNGILAFASRFGVQIDPAQGELEAADAVISKMVPAMRPAGSGTMSDKDVELFKKAAPRLMNTEEGNKIIAGTMRAVAEYDATRGQLIMDMNEAGSSSAEIYAALQRLPNPLSNVHEMLIDFPENTTPAAKKQARDALLLGISPEEVQAAVMADHEEAMRQATASVPASALPPQMASSPQPQPVPQPVPQPQMARPLPMLQPMPIPEPRSRMRLDRGPASLQEWYGQ